MKAKNLALILAAGISLTGCGINIWSGKIGNEIVTEMSYPTKTEILIRKSDGRIITYVDRGGDSKIDSVEITKDNYSVTYRNNEIGKEALAVAQQQYEDYLAKILVERKRKALEDVRN